MLEKQVHVRNFCKSKIEVQVKAPKEQNKKTAKLAPLQNDSLGKPSFHFAQD